MCFYFFIFCFAFYPWICRNSARWEYAQSDFLSHFAWRHRWRYVVCTVTSAWCNSVAVSSCLISKKQPPYNRIFCSQPRLQHRTPFPFSYGDCKPHDLIWPWFTVMAYWHCLLSWFAVMEYRSNEEEYLTSWIQFNSWFCSRVINVKCGDIDQRPMLRMYTPFWWLYFQLK